MSRSLSLLGLGLLLLAGSGCASRATSKFVPAPAAARQALEHALDVWQAGQPPEGQNESPPIHLVDCYCRAGVRLASYEIVQEEKQEGPRVFSVRLNTVPASPAGVVKYYVVGKNPVLVYREDDYQAPAGM